MTATPGGLAAVGFGADGAQAWWSQGGAVWRLANMPPSSGARLSSVAPVAGGLVAVGSGTTGPIALASADGRTWRALGDTPWVAGDEVDTVVALGTGVVVGGSSGSAAATWRGVSR